MKIYEFKIVVWSGFFVIAYLSVFIFGLIWLNNGFNVDERISQVYSNIKPLEEKINKLEYEQKLWISLSKAESELTNKLIYEPQYKKDIMESCLKGAKTHGN